MLHFKMFQILTADRVKRVNLIIVPSFMSDRPAYCVLKQNDKNPILNR